MASLISGALNRMASSAWKKGGLLLTTGDNAGNAMGLLLEGTRIV
jgi:hypothetical protein